ncbi:hypothetical protein ALO94_200845 [Pseudomonas syringae pv. spinaceae]|uniref:Uncharacterized protein n=1 Tax=Pseudomonas syringae pv. spinaceae TaxID=264459 RepID=A0A0Q0CME8_PSESX|nr:hypothetical protein ALO94_200845 [Pseudomonas syringae pv. spinaceae]
MIKRLCRARLGGLLGNRLQRIEGGTDLFQLVAVARAEILAATDTGDFLERRFVQIKARAQAQRALQGVFIGVRADADGVDFHAFFGGQPCGSNRIDLPRVVGAIGDQHQHTAVGRAQAQAFQGQADSIANGGILACNAYFRFVEPDPHGASVIGQRCLNKCLRAEQDQADPITLAAFQKVAKQLLDQHQSADFIAFPGTRFSSEHHYAVFLKGNTHLTAHLATPVLIDAQTLQVTAVVERPWYMDALGMSQPLHFGDYGGMPMKVLWAVLDVLTIIVLGSGVYLWWVRRRVARSVSAVQAQVAQ